MNEKNVVNTYRYSDFNEQELVKKYDNWYERNTFAYLSEVNAVKKIKPKGLGLEVGVGTGRFSSVLNVPYGLDPAKECLKLAHQRGVKVTLAVGEYLPFKDETFDFVMMFITLSFFHNPEQAYLEANRVLKEGRKIVIGMVDKNSFLGKLYQRKKTEGYPFYREATLFSPSKVIDSLKETGFEKFEIHQTIFDFPEKLKNVQQPKKGYGDGAFVVISAKKCEIFKHKAKLIKK